MKTKKPTMGRPSKGLTEAAVLVRGPYELIAAARQLAEYEGVLFSEWLRAAISERIKRKNKEFL